MKCIYCGKTIKPGLGANPEDYGLHPFIDWDNVGRVCSSCDIIVTQTDRILKMYLDSGRSSRYYDMLLNHIESFNKIEK